MHILQFEAETLKSDTMNWYSCIEVFDIIDIIIISSRHENYIIREVSWKTVHLNFSFSSKTYYISVIMKQS